MQKFWWILMAGVLFVFAHMPSPWAANEGDVEALHFIVTVDKNEIRAAEAVLDKNVAPEVAAYATMLRDEHRQSMDKTIAVLQNTGIPPVDTAAVQQLREQGDKDVAALMPLDGDALSNAYVLAMIDGHTNVLDMMDVQLIPAIKDSAVKKHVTRMRERIAQHLADARKIQDNRRPQPGSEG